MENNEKKKVLIVETVEDDGALREILQKKLSLEGFKVIEAKNGEEGMAMALQEHPDLILLDIMMPGMDGLTMMRELRNKNEWGRNVPIILLTNLNPDNDERIHAIAEHHPAYYIVKAESSMHDILEKVRERLSRGAVPS